MNLFVQDCESRLMKVTYKYDRSMLCRVNFDTSLCHFHFRYSWDLPLLTRIARLVLFYYLIKKDKDAISSSEADPFQINDLVVFWKSSEWLLSKHVLFGCASKKYMCKDQIFIKIISIERISTSEITHLNKNGIIVNNNDKERGHSHHLGYYDNGCCDNVDKHEPDIENISLHDGNNSNSDLICSNIDDEDNLTMVLEQQDCRRPIYDKILHQSGKGYECVNKITSYRIDNCSNLSKELDSEALPFNLEMNVDQNNENKDLHQTNEKYLASTDTCTVCYTGNIQNKMCRSDCEQMDNSIKDSIVVDVPYKESSNNCNLSTVNNDIESPLVLRRISSFSVDMNACSSLVHVRLAFKLITHSIINNTSVTDISHYLRVVDVTTTKISNLFHSCIPIFAHNDGPVIDILITDRNHESKFISDFVILTNLHCYAISIDSSSDVDDKDDCDTIKPCENTLLDPFFSCRIVHKGSFEPISSESQFCQKIYQELKKYRQLQYTRDTSVSYNCMHYSESWQHYIIVGTIKSVNLIDAGITRLERLGSNRIPSALIYIVDVRKLLIRSATISRQLAKLMLPCLKQYDHDTFKRYLDCCVESAQIFQFTINAVYNEVVEIREYNITWRSSL
ncbi:hypothetical protein GJ496_009060 [Pomphorhynchus laevis]|nr:hypothetical protein GJ496_009060 [Pomphorhynchus laevis]